MPDISTVWNVQGGAGDWVMTPAGLQSGDDLDTALFISLFTDQTAGADDVIPDGTNDPRGWWGDLDGDYPIGSKLWLLSRSEQTLAVLNLAQLYAQQATQWMLDDGVVASISFTASFPRTGMLGLQGVITRPDGTTKSFNYAWAWQELT